ncbi:AlwI family type II restriction endonuclease [Campylobacter hyointestinalis]|uniref:AlwI family type II restriction endonuclease n=1 Tax=Campylobacter hyointestinalis TaxID=198 RepID=UPI000DCC2746|nr:AlwI family type II restriction endonuclease [Campylobacter hyointestinalis]RAZ52106.1 AlwI family type II restriction endonuclease [Campylobacter hyointestinalis subsp. lawsonii]
MKREFKPLSFSTTIRNPARIVEFLEVLAKFDRQILTDEIIMSVVFELVKRKIYVPNFAKNFANFEELSDDQVLEIIANSPQNHKEAGFEKGWPSRFDTWYKLIMEFGFCFYAMNETILISQSGYLLLNSANDDDKIAKIFLNCMSKYVSNNPFRNTLNSNIPLVLLLNVMNDLKNKIGNSKISLREIPLFICWRDDDFQNLTNEILDLRSEFGFEVSNEIIYEKCLNLLNSTNEKRFKISQICFESVDEFVRKMRITGIISLRGNGRFIDFNTFEIANINYLLNLNLKPQNFNSKFEYFEFISKIDQNFLIQNKISNNSQNVLKQKTLCEFASKYTKKQIFSELKILQNKKSSSKDEIFKFISEPTRFEFLTAIALKQNLKNTEIFPNYKIDDEGLPTSHAVGNEADIYCVDLATKAIIEVSLMNGKAQIINEMLPITRHLKDRGDDFAIFVAPKIFEDCKRYAKFIKFNENLEIINYDIDEFIMILSGIDNLKGLKNV